MMMVCAWWAYWSRTALASSSASRTPSSSARVRSSEPFMLRRPAAVSTAVSAKSATSPPSPTRSRRAVAELRPSVTGDVTVSSPSSRGTPPARAGAGAPATVLPRKRPGFTPVREKGCRWHEGCHGQGRTPYRAQPEIPR